ncbi:MAG: hypothetical protein J6Y02_20240 [Pseudobutyrivibrio sp.]|nr:hypothetical protein [Pseudobutyrivibrio sp.]
MWIGQTVKVRDNSYIRRIGCDDIGNVWKPDSKSWTSLYGQTVTVLSEPVCVMINPDFIGIYSVEMIQVMTSDFQHYWILFKGDSTPLYQLPENPYKFFFIVEANNAEQYFPTVKEAQDALKLRKESGRVMGSGRIYQAFFGHEGKTTLLLDSYGYDQDSQKFWQEDGSKTTLI